MRAVLSFDEETANVTSIATEVTEQTIGQNAPALLSQTVPLQRKYWAIPIPRTHGMTPNTLAVTSAFRRIGEVSMHCSFRGLRGKNWIESWALYGTTALLYDLEHGMD
jgi:hypothetical protein